MAAPTTLTVTYGSGPSNVTVNIPNGIDRTQAVRNIAYAGGVWFTDSTGLLTFIPVGQISKITAQ